MQARYVCGCKLKLVSRVKYALSQCAISRFKLTITFVKEGQTRDEISRERMDT